MRENRIKRKIREGQPVTVVSGHANTDDNVERYLAAGVRFTMTGWTNWVAQGARAFLHKVAAKSAG